MTTGSSPTTKSTTPPQSTTYLPSSTPPKPDLTEDADRTKGSGNGSVTTAASIPSSGRGEHNGQGGQNRSDPINSNITEIPSTEGGRSQTDAPEYDVSTREEVITDKPVTDKPVTNKPVTDKPVTNKTVTDKPVTDQPQTDKPVMDKMITDEAVTDKKSTSKLSTTAETQQESPQEQARVSSSSEPPSTTVTEARDILTSSETREYVSERFSLATSDSGVQTASSTEAVYNTVVSEVSSGTQVVGEGPSSSEKGGEISTTSEGSNSTATDKPVPPAESDFFSTRNWILTKSSTEPLSSNQGSVFDVTKSEAQEPTTESPSEQTIPVSSGNLSNVTTAAQLVTTEDEVIKELSSTETTEGVYSTTPVISEAQDGNKTDGQQISDRFWSGPVTTQPTPTPTGPVTTQDDLTPLERTEPTQHGLETSTRAQDEIETSAASRNETMEPTQGKPQDGVITSDQFWNGPKTTQPNEKVDSEPTRNVPETTITPRKSTSAVPTTPDPTREIVSRTPSQTRNATSNPPTASTSILTPPPGTLELNSTQESVSDTLSTDTLSTQIPKSNASHTRDELDLWSESGGVTEVEGVTISTAIHSESSTSSDGLGTDEILSTKQDSRTAFPTSTTIDDSVSDISSSSSNVPHRITPTSFDVSFSTSRDTTPTEMRETSTKYVEVPEVPTTSAGNNVSDRSTLLPTDFKSNDSSTSREERITASDKPIPDSTSPITSEGLVTTNLTTEGLVTTNLTTEAHGGEGSPTHTANERDFWGSLVPTTTGELETPDITTTRSSSTSSTNRMKTPTLHDDIFPRSSTGPSSTPTDSVTTSTSTDGFVTTNLTTKAQVIIHTTEEVSGESGETPLSSGVSSVGSTSSPRETVAGEEESSTSSVTPPFPTSEGFGSFQSKETQVT